MGKKQGKPYPRPEEESGIDSACEPIAMAARSDYHRMDTVSSDEVDSLDWNQFPMLGPKSQAEAVSRVEQIEKEGCKWVTIDHLHQELKNRHPWL